MKLGKTVMRDAYSMLGRSGAVQVRMYTSDSEKSRFTALGGTSLSTTSVVGVVDSSLSVEPDADNWVVLLEEYDLESAGESEKGSLGARGRFA